METALVLSCQPDTRVAIFDRAEGFHGSKNIEEMLRAIETGRVELICRSKVTWIEPSSAVLMTPEGEQQGCPAAC